jgi:hypothetical protein
MWSVDLCSPPRSCARQIGERPVLPGCCRPGMSSMLFSSRYLAVYPTPGTPCRSRRPRAVGARIDHRIVTPLERAPHGRSLSPSRRAARARSSRRQSLFRAFCSVTSFTPEQAHPRVRPGSSKGSDSRAARTHPAACAMLYSSTLGPSACACSCQLELVAILRPRIASADAFSFNSFDGVAADALEKPPWPTRTSPCVFILAPRRITQVVAAPKLMR